jgi:hypothetical protein
MPDCAAVQFAENYVYNASLVFFLSIYMFNIVSCENRSPGLALVLSTALLLSADAFWLQQILKLSDVHLSCSFVVWITYATYPTILLSSVFRYV